MRSSVLVLGLLCCIPAVRAQAPAPAEPPQQQASATQQTQSESAWKTQFSGENWSLEETRIEPNLVRLTLKMNRFYSGGAGESRLIFERHAKALVRAGDYYSYQVVDYKESLNSFLFGGQRIAEGTIRLLPRI